MGGCRTSVNGLNAQLSLWTRHADRSRRLSTDNVKAVSIFLVILCHANLLFTQAMAQKVGFLDGLVSIRCGTRCSLCAACCSCSLTARAPAALVLPVLLVLLLCSLLLLLLVLPPLALPLLNAPQPNKPVTAGSW